MRVATYIQPAPITRGSLAALSILVLTILIGTAVLPVVLAYVGFPFVSYTTYLWMLLYVLAFIGLMVGQGINWVSWLVRYRILLVVLLLGTVLSTLWSVDSGVSAARAVHLVGSTLLGVYLGFTVPLLKLLRVLGTVLGGIMLASAVAALVLPGLGIVTYEGQLVWRGVFNQKNDLGFWAATAVLLYLTLSDTVNTFLMRLLCYLFAGLSLALLAFSHSATSLLAMVVGGALALYLFIAARFRLGFVQMTVVAVLFVALVALAALNIDTAELVGRSDDLTGRGEVWRQVWHLIVERPLTGYGYGTLWYPTDATLYIQQRYTDFTWVVYHAHNGFLQIASEIGLPLAVVALLMITQQLVEIFYCQYQRRQPGVLFVLAYVVAYVVGNYSEARFLVNRELYWILFVALPISMLRQINVVSADAPDTAATEDDEPDLPPDPMSGPGRGEPGRGEPGRGGPGAGSGRVRPGRGRAPRPAVAMPAGAGGMAFAGAGSGTGGPRGAERAGRDDDASPGRPGLVRARDAEDDVTGRTARTEADLAAAVDGLDALFGEDGQGADGHGMDGHGGDGHGMTRYDPDRYDKTFDTTGDGTDEWFELPAGRGARR